MMMKYVCVGGGGRGELAHHPLTYPFTPPTQPASVGGGVGGAKTRCLAVLGGVVDLVCLCLPCSHRL